jgi:hypothetical protein
MVSLQGVVQFAWLPLVESPGTTLPLPAGHEPRVRNRLTKTVSPTAKATARPIANADSEAT